MQFGFSGADSCHGSCFKNAFMDKTLRLGVFARLKKHSIDALKCVFTFKRGLKLKNTSKITYETPPKIAELHDNSEKPHREPKKVYL